MNFGVVSLGTQVGVFLGPVEVEAQLGAGGVEVLPEGCAEGEDGSAVAGVVSDEVGDGVKTSRVAYFGCGIGSRLMTVWSEPVLSNETSRCLILAVAVGGKDEFEALRFSSF